DCLFVLLIGAASGFATTIFLGGHDVPVPPLFNFLEENTPLYILYRIVQNTVLGGVGALVYWVVTLGHDFSADDIDPGLVVLAISSGATGGVLLNTIFSQTTNKQTLESLRKSYDTMVKSLAAPAGPAAPAPAGPAAPPAAGPAAPPAGG